MLTMLLRLLLTIGTQQCSTWTRRSPSRNPRLELRKIHLRSRRKFRKMLEIYKITLQPWALLHFPYKRRIILLSRRREGQHLRRIPKRPILPFYKTRQTTNKNNKSLEMTKFQTKSSKSSPKYTCSLLQHNHCNDASSVLPNSLERSHDYFASKRRQITQPKASSYT